jgi:hypothetical protein
MAIARSAPKRASTGIDFVALFAFLTLYALLSDPHYWCFTGIDLDRANCAATASFDKLDAFRAAFGSKFDVAPWPPIMAMFKPTHFAFLTGSSADFVASSENSVCSYTLAASSDFHAPVATKADVSRPATRRINAPNEWRKM